MSFKHRLVASITAAAVALGSLSTAIVLAPKASAEVSINFDEGSYSVWDGTSYTFDWYENPAVIDGVTTYTITQASDLAGLAVITNNLSNEKFNYITDNLSEADKGYASLVDSFEGKIIKLATDIDLADYDWLGIGYPWSTPALTASTEFTNTDGETVKYNAVSHIPDDTVDPWVGDKNGNPISTRYWEYPESELRFRDYTKAITQDATHKLIAKDINFGHSDDLLDYKMFPSIRDDTMQGLYFTCKKGPVYAFDVKSGEDLGSDSSGAQWVDGVSAYGWSVGGVLPVLESWGINYETDIAIPYTFQDIKNYTETKGFAGTFDGQNYKIKGLNPDTTWTDDTLERLTTYEPLARGLFSLLDEKGTIKSLEVKGSYDNEICSYSAVLCAWNYGTIEDCYVDGQMEQSLVEQIYPVARDYDPDGSVYKLSDVAGGVLPSGNAGFMTSQNYGTIKNSYTVGEVTQAFRQFGFFASTNYGEIDNCVNKANFSMKALTKDDMDFHTDEWQLTNSRTLNMFNDVISDSYEPHWNPLSGYTQPTEELPLSIHHTNMVNGALLIGSSYLARCSSAGFNGLYTSTRIPWDCNEKLWIPDLYKTEEGESIAANHLYGCYEITLAGGIAAVNIGNITECLNRGSIDTSESFLTVCNSAFAVYSDDVNTLDDASDVYSYIRAFNQYGIFSTAVNGVKYRGGISAVNLGCIASCTNSGEVDLTHEEEYYDELYYPDKTVRFNDKHLQPIAMIAATQNAFYQNDVRFVLDNGEIVYTPWGLHWWITEDTVDEYLDTYINSEQLAGSGITREHFDRNMPYPFYKHGRCEIWDLAAGITAANAGEIKDSINENDDTHVSIVYASSKNINADTPRISNCYGNTLFAHYITNTFVSDIDHNGNFAHYIQQTGENETDIRDIRLPDDVTFSFSIMGENKEKLMVDNIVLGGTTNMSTRCIDTATLSDIYLENTITETLNNAALNNIVINDFIDDIEDDRYYGSRSRYEEFGSVVIADNITDSIIDSIVVINSNILALTRKAANTSLNNIEVYNNGKCGIGQFKNCVLKNFKIFADDSYIFCDECEVEQFISYGTITENYVDYHSEDYVYNFVNSDCKDMWLESDIEFEFDDPLVSGKIQKIPGVLKAYLDTNVFENCGIVTPDGMISYTTRNILSGTDDSIKTDAKLVYSKRAAQNGALAYYLDKGYTDNRTNEFTVAFDDTVVLSNYIPEDIYNYIDSSTVSTLSQSRKLPAYTRRKVSEDEDSYYRVQVPYITAGAGEVRLSVEREDDTWTTNASDNLFPKIELFAIPGETIKFDISAEDGFECKSLTWATKTETKKLESIADNSLPYQFKQAIMPDEDVVIQSEYSGIWRIEIDESVSEWLSLQTSANGAVYDRLINIAFDILDTNYDVGDVFYYTYYKNADNDWVLDTTEKHSIDLTTASFLMPNTHIRLYATPLNSDARLVDMVIAGEHGVIDEFNNVTVILESSIDITNLTVDSVELSEGASISPDISIPQDFTNPVEYIVTSESGMQTKYLVTVKTTIDGLITQFDLKGRHGVIDQDAGTITITLADTEDITNVPAYVIWSGVSITPDPSMPKDYSNSDVVYTVTSSTGETKSYTIKIETRHFDSVIEELAIELDGQALSYSINPVTKTILVEYPYGADVSDVKLAAFAFAGTNSNLVEGQSINLTISHQILMVDEIGNTDTYTLMANELPNPEKIITQFVLFGCEGIIDQVNNTILVTVPSKYDLTSITPDAIAYIGESITDVSTRKDYTQPVTITVTAFDGTQKQYTVTTQRS